MSASARRALENVTTAVGVTGLGYFVPATLGAPTSFARASAALAAVAAFAWALSYLPRNE